MLRVDIPRRGIFFRENRRPFFRNGTFPEIVVFLSKWDQIWVNLGSISENSPSISGGSPPGISDTTSPVLRVDIPRRALFCGK